MISLRVFEEVAKSINKHIELNYKLITIKDIKLENNIENNNRSRNNLYSLTLKRLEIKNFVEKTSSKYYKILRPITTTELEKINNELESLNKIIKKKQNPEKYYKICDFCNKVIKRKGFKHINRSKNQIHIFCSKTCKENWIFNKTRLNT